MNFTFVLPDSSTLSGVVTWSMETARQLANCGRQTYLIVHNYSESDVYLQELTGVQVIGCDNKPANEANLADISHYQSIYETVLPSIIVPNWSPAAFATCASILSHRDKALTVIGYAHSDDASYYSLLSYYEPIISKFVAVSSEVATRLVESIPHRRDDILVKAYAVRVSPQLERSYSDGQNNIRLLYAGRLDENQKRVSDLIVLAKILSAKKVDFKLHIVGDGPVKSALIRQIKKLDDDTRRRVELAGPVPHEEMPGIWRNADICVLVSGYEGTSVAMLEAMAQGCVPVVTAVSGTRDVIKPNVNGFMVEVGDLEGMAETIAGLADNRTTLSELGRNAYATVLRDYSYQEYLNWFMSLAKQSANEQPRTWPGDRPLLAFQTGRYSRRIVGMIRRLRLDSYPATWQLVAKMRKWKQLLWN